MNRAEFEASSYDLAVVGGLAENAVARCKIGELCWLARVSRPDICARLARIASGANSSQGSDVYRIDDIVWTIKVLRKAIFLKYRSASHMGKPGE